MNIIELQEQRNLLKTELQTISTTAQTEERKLNEAEETRMNEVKKEIADIDAQIKANEEENRKLQEDAAKNKDNKKTERKMPTLISQINSVVNNRALDEAAQKACDEARAEFRKSGLSTKGQIVLRSTITAQDPGQGQENVAENKTNIEVALRNALVATRMGANFLGGLVGDVSIPRYSGSTVLWKGETAEAEDGAGTFDEVNISPKRLTATIDLSKQFLLQDSHDAEAMLINDLAKAIAEKLDQTIFGSDEGDATKPAGLFHGAVAETSIDAIDYSTVLDIEQKMEEKNAGDYMFVMSPSVKFALKGTQKASGIGMVLEGNEADGINYISSNSVKSKGILAIDPRSLVIGQWGGIDILVDPYTKAASGMIRLVVNAYFDAAMKSDRIEKQLFS